MIVFDVTRQNTFEAVEKWLMDIRTHLPTIPVILLANKCDLLEFPQQQHNMPALNAFVKVIYSTSTSTCIVEYRTIICKLFFRLIFSWYLKSIKVCPIFSGAVIFLIKKLPHRYSETSLENSFNTGKESTWIYKFTSPKNSYILVAGIYLNFFTQLKSFDDFLQSKSGFFLEI